MTFETIRTMLVGYARVSTNEQTLDLQKDALEKCGCTKIYSDVVSGAKEERKGCKRPWSMSGKGTPSLSGAWTG